METERLKKIISQGDIKTTIALLLELANEVYTSFASEIILLSARYSQVTLEYNRCTLPRKDYEIEINSITMSLLSILDSIDGLSEKNFKKKKSREEIISEILELDKRFAQSRKNASKIKSNPTRLREKNDISRSLGEIFINHSELIPEYLTTDSEGIITGIANKFKKVPEVAGIDFFENVAARVTGDFTRGCITNALAEIIYTGQIRIGDDERIQNILTTLSVNASYPALKNIECVRAELDYFLGKIIC